MVAFHTGGLYLAAALWAVSALPTAHAYCDFDGYGRENCSLSTGVRIAIGVAVAVAGILSIMTLMFIRRRRARRTNLAYITSPNVGPPVYPPQGYGNSGYPQNTNTGYDSYVSQGQGQGEWQQYPPYGQGQYPQYPPPTHTGYDPQSGFAPPMEPPQYTPPAGHPPPLGGKEGV